MIIELIVICLLLAIVLISVLNLLQTNALEKRNRVILNNIIYSPIESLEEKIVNCMYLIEKGQLTDDNILYGQLRESICNRYEILCYEYLNGNMDKRLFEDLYFHSIKQAFQSEHYKQFYSPDSDYNCFEFTTKVYNILKDKLD